MVLNFALIGSVNHIRISRGACFRTASILRFGMIERGMRPDRRGDCPQTNEK